MTDPIFRFQFYWCSYRKIYGIPKWSGRVGFGFHWDTPRKTYDYKKFKNPTNWNNLQLSSIVNSCTYIVVGKFGFYANVWSWEKDDDDVT